MQACSCCNTAVTIQIRQVRTASHCAVRLTASATRTSRFTLDIRSCPFWCASSSVDSCMRRHWQDRLDARHRAAAKAPPSTRLRDSYRQKLTLSTPPLDRLLGGGIPCGLITELTGEASAGKTQVCLQLLLNAQLPLHIGGFDGSALYICTEGNAPLARLQQLVESRGWGGDLEVLERIIIKQDVHTPQQLITALHQADSVLAEPREKRVRLLIVDSIAAPFRDVGDKPGVQEYGARSEQLFQVSALLRKYALTYDLAVVVTNQVTDLFCDGDVYVKKAGATGGLHLRTSGREVLPALGLAWSNCINQRLFLAKRSHPALGGGGVCELRVVFSPFRPQGSAHYVVEQGGVRGLAPEELQLAPGSGGIGECAGSLQHPADNVMGGVQPPEQARNISRNAQIEEAMAAALAYTDEDYSDYVITP